MTASTYVISGGNESFVDALTPFLRATRIVRISAGAAEESVEPAGPITSWIHIVPGTGGEGALSEASAVTAAVERAGRVLPEGEGAMFLSVVPVFGILSGAAEAAAELAASVAVGLAQVNIADWSRRGLRINTIAYGAVDGPSLPGAGPADVLAARTPMHRLAAPQELANAIDFLSSSAASYVTGTVLPVDGGWTAYSWFYPARDL
jgi:NAD(P)-dependent dehydrogenase (short-subunit alcohol dehydrogenase family)